MRLARLLARRHRGLVAAWLALLTALSAGTASAYQSTYASDTERLAAVELARGNLSTVLLYGRLPTPLAARAVPAALYGWEIGAFVTILAALLAVLLTVSLTRATEDSGMVELLRSTGLSPAAPLRAALMVLGAVGLALAGLSAGAAGIWAGRVDGITWPAALAYGGVVGLTFALTAALTAVAAQVAPSAGGARALGLAAVGLALAVRAGADRWNLGWLNGLSPLGLREAVRPFGATRWWVLAAASAAVVPPGALAVALSQRREIGSGLIGRRDRHSGRLRIRSAAGLAVRLDRRGIVAWTAGVAAIGILFSAMGSGVVEESRRGELGGFLGSQLGPADPVAGYLGYIGTLVGLVASAFAVVSVLRAGRAEAQGLTAGVLATGRRRWTPLAAQVAVTAGGLAVILAVTGAGSALVAPAALGGGHDAALRAFTYTVGQWPAAMAVAGVAALLAGTWPRAAGLAWTPVVASGVLALLGALLGLPVAVRRLGVFQHVPDVAAARPDSRGLVVLVAVAALGVAGGLLGVSRRDLTAG